MARLPVALIRAKEYEAFRRIPTYELPGDFADWDKNRSQEALQISRSGDQAVRVEISANEFAAFCRAGKKRADLRALGEFVAEVFRRQEHERLRTAMLNGGGRRG